MLDFNLLRALDALLEEGSVTGAAQRLRLSPPAMSRTLTRIRQATGDAILVRTGRVMVPTPYALAVRADVHRLVHEVNGVLAPQQEVDPSTLDRTFTLRWHDALTDLAGPEVLAAVRAQAPLVRLIFLAESVSDEHGGHVDLAAGADAAALPDLRHATVGEDQLVVLLRADHPLADQGLTTEAYAAAAHVTVSRRGLLSDPVDSALAEAGLRRDVAAAVPTLAAALRFVRDGGLLATVPAAIARRATADREVISRPLPVPTTSLRLYLSWHRRYDNDPAHRWLRDVCLGVLQTHQVAPE
ncbi:LysR family transcriptional regulator [Streptomyces misionensis]|uniref:LysR family transcriptional regulator n=1 Tax=Streptomyces misionensis TaxID=67331 RepID=UPI0033E84761